MLKAARVLVVGLGGLGSSTTLYLAGAGVGRLGLLDGDEVVLSDLHRQILYRTDDLGRPKADAALETVQALNDRIRVISLSRTLDESNAFSLIANFDFVCDCTDNFETRLVINRACHTLNLPFCHGGIQSFQGQVTTIHTAEGSPCYRCLYAKGAYPDVPKEREPAGVLGPLPGVIGALQAMEAIKFFLGRGDLLYGRLMIMDVLHMKSLLVPFEKKEGCSVCGAL
jgi:adenylyltransferase/sulfurtransferase